MTDEDENEDESEEENEEEDEEEPEEIENNFVQSPQTYTSEMEESKHSSHLSQYEDEAEIVTFRNIIKEETNLMLTNPLD